jgi:hypothetical protein
MGWGNGEQLVLVSLSDQDNPDTYTMSATMNENDGGKWTMVGRSGSGWGTPRSEGGAAAGGAGAWRPSGPRTFGVSSGAGEAPMTRTGLGRTASSSGAADYEPPSRGTGGWGAPSGRSGAGRPMPAAFGGAERDRHNDRLEEQRSRAAAEAEEKRREERAREAAERDRARRMDFTNTEEYPSLGGGSRSEAAAPKVKPKLDFRAAGERGAVLGAMREAEEAAAAKEQQFASFVAQMEAEERAAHRRRLAQITTRCFDDGFDEYEPPEEDEDDIAAREAGGFADDGEMPAYEDDEEGGGGGEINSHLAVIRRRGDKSDW